MSAEFEVQGLKVTDIAQEFGTPSTSTTGTRCTTA